MAQVAWIASFWPDAFYLLGAAVAGRRGLDQTTVEALRPWVASLPAWARSPDGWSQLVVAAALDDSGDTDGRGPAWHVAARRWVQQADPQPSAALEKAANIFVAHLAAAGEDLQRNRPRLASELALRTRPLRDQWLARGPGFLRQIDRWLDVVTPAQDPLRVVAVTPVVGGHGDAVPEQQAVVIEALLTNTDERLPELLRLAWLITQLRLTRADGMKDERIDVSRRERAALLLTLAIAHDLEWFTMPQPPCALALRHWLHVPESLAEPAAQMLDPIWGPLAQARGDVDLLRRCTDRLPIGGEADD